MTSKTLGDGKKYHRDTENGFLESASRFSLWNSRQDTLMYIVISLHRIEKRKASLDEMDTGSEKRSNPAALSQFNQFPSQFWPAGKYLKESHQPRRTRAGADEISTVYIVA